MSVLAARHALPDPLAGEGAREADEAELLRAALVAALDAIPTEAFVARANGDVLLANARGREHLASDSDGLTALLAAAVGSSSHEKFRVSPIRDRDGTHTYLLVERPGADENDRRVTTTAERWRLTRAESRVFRRLASGDSNKAIARDLGCSVRTVELHVSSVLKKARSRSRAELLVKLWGRAP